MNREKTDMFLDRIMRLRLPVLDSLDLSDLGLNGLTKFEVLCVNSHVQVL